MNPESIIPANESLNRRDTLRHMLAMLATATAVPTLTSTAFGQAHGNAGPHASQAAKISTLLTKDLAATGENEVNMVLVEYQGGGSSPAHRHAGPVFVYVLEGSVEMQITDGPLTTLKKGETFYEPPGGVHLVSRNASKTEPAKLLALVIGPKGTPPTGPVDKH